MKIFFFIFLTIKELLANQNRVSQSDNCFGICFNSTKCDQDFICKNQINQCDNLCVHFASPHDQFYCLKMCIDHQFSNFNEHQNFFDCGNQCQEENFAWEAQNSKKQLRQKILDDPFSHPGTTLQDIDCDSNEIPLAVVIEDLDSTNNQMIVKYFMERCDTKIYDIRDKSAPIYNFKWAVNQNNFQFFQEYQQIINQLPNKKNITNKKNYALALRGQDMLQKYQINSTDFFGEFLIFEPQTYQDFISKISENETTIWMDQKNNLYQGSEQIIQKIKSLKFKSDEFIIQKYIEQPLLLNKKKFDLRVYVLIASTYPVVYMYQLGFARKCIEDYDLNIYDSFKHDTTISFQKNHPKYEEQKEELMMTPPQLLEQLKQEHNIDEEDLKKSIEYLIAYFMKSIQKVKLIGTFQILTFDILFDQNFKPHLKEVQTKLTYSNTLRAHKYLIPQLIQSTLDLILESNKQIQMQKQVWYDPDSLDLGRWIILYNQATGYDFLKPYQIIE